MSHKPKTDNTRKDKFSRNYSRTSTYLTRNGARSHSVILLLKLPWPGVRNAPIHPQRHSAPSSSSLQSISDGPPRHLRRRTFPASRWIKLSLSPRHIVSYSQPHDKGHFEKFFAPQNQPTCNRTPEPMNRRIGGKSYTPETDNTRKNKFSRNKTSTYSVRKGGLSPLHSAAKARRLISIISA